MTITYKIAMAAGWDAANRQMKAEGRTSWNEDDWDLAASIAELLGLVGTVPTLKAPYPFCRRPELCAGKGYCDGDPACNE